MLASMLSGIVLEVWFGEVAGAVAVRADGWEMVLFVVIFVCCVGSVRGGGWLLGGEGVVGLFMRAG